MIQNIKSNQRSSPWGLQRVVRNAMQRQREKKLLIELKF